MKLNFIILGLGRPHNELPGNGKIAAMDRQRLLGRQAPFPAEPFVTVCLNEMPERGIP